MPAEPFEMGRLFALRVDRYGQISVRTIRYSVPVRLIGRQVRAMLHASELVVYDDGVEVARHERLMTKAASDAGPLPGGAGPQTRSPARSTTLEQARSEGKFTPVHDAWWAATCKTHRPGRHESPDRGRAAGSAHAHEHLVAGLAAALPAGAMTGDAVALEARKAAEADNTSALAVSAGPSEQDPFRQPSVASLTERRLAHLSPDTRPLPSVAVAVSWPA